MNRRYPKGRRADPYDAKGFPVRVDDDRRIFAVNAVPTPDDERVASPVGLHRVLEPTGDDITLPQTARRLDARPQLWPDEVRIAVDTLNLDAASYRQLAEKHSVDGHVEGGAVRAEVLGIIATRGKMQNP